MTNVDQAAPRPVGARQPKENRRKRYRQAWANVRSSLFWRILRRQKKWLRSLFVAIFFFAFAQSQVSRMTVDLVDTAIVAQVVRPADYVAPILKALVLFLAAAGFSQFVLERIMYQVEYDLRTSIYNAVHSADVQRLNSVVGGQIVTRVITDLRQLEMVMRLVPTVGVLIPIVLGILVYLTIVSPPAALVAASSVPVNLWLVRRFSPRLKALSWAELNERAEVTSAFGEPVRGIRVVHAFGQYDHERRRLADRALRVFRFSMTRERLLARYDIWMKFLPLAIQGAFVFLGARLVAGDDLSLGVFLIAFNFVGIVSRIASLMDHLASQWQYLSTAQKRLEDVLALGSRRHSFGRPIPPVGSGVELAGVTKCFDDRPVLSDFDLAVRPGELVVITGAPGSGKSTIGMLASGIVTADAGDVRLEGVRLSDLDPAEVRKAVRLVTEEPFLFATSVRENLLLAADTKTDEATMRRALWAAKAEDVIDDLPGGLDGEVGDRGLTLSGGQRQRLALARALVAPPRVLVLDDALSAVSPSLEIDILQRIRTHAPQTAILCIGRREGPSTIADRVLRLPDPIVVAPAPGPAAAVVAGSQDALQRRLSMLAAGAGLQDVASLRAATTLKLSKDVPTVEEEAIRKEGSLRFRHLAKPFASFGVLALLVLVVKSSSNLAPHYLFGSAGDYARQGETDKTDLLALGIVAFGLSYSLSNYAFRVLAQRFSQGVVYLLRRRLFHRLSRLGIDYYDRELPGQVAARVTHDIDVLVDFFKEPLFQFLTVTAQFVVALILIAVLGPQILSLLLVFALLILGATILQYSINTRALSAVRTHFGTVTAKFEEDYAARHEIRGYGAEPVQLAKFLKASDDLRKARRRVAIVQTVFQQSIQVLSQILAMAVLVRTGNLVLGAAISVGSALTLRTVVQEAVAPLDAIAQTWNRFLEVRVSWSRLKQPFEAPILPVIRTHARECPPLDGRIVFDGVGFTYPHTGRRVLSGISFGVEPGHTVALVGYTGAGKSSISKLLTRMYDPDEGRVLVDGLDVREVDLATFRRRLAVVPQDAYVFKGTVAGNIAYGRSEIDLEQVEAAARAVGAHDVLTALPDGYEHPVEEEGKNLTAAQRQLIALARAWFVQPSVLVLDESTSALDTKVECDVLDALDLLPCTKVMVTHRENVVRRADQVVVIDGGRVVETGTPVRLMRPGTAFYRLWHTGGGASAGADATKRPRRRRARAAATVEPVVAPTTGNGNGHAETPHTPIKTSVVGAK